MSKAPDPPSPRRRLVRALLTAASVACLLGCLAWTVAGLGWAPDMAAVFTFQILIVTGVVLLASSVVRAKAAGLITACALGLGVAGMVIGRDLVIAGPASPGEPTLRVLVFNSHALNAEHDACATLIRETDADVVVLIEPEIEFSRWIRWDRSLEGAYPNLHTRDWVKGTVSPIIVLSRLPTAEIDFGRAPDEDRFLLGVEIDTAFGPVALMAGQPRSPRSASRWAAGGREARLHAAAAHQLHEQGIPVLFCADLNSTPAGARGLTLRSVGLTPCKPLLSPAGTYPAALPWPARIALDDAWRSDDLRVVSWDTVGPAGSDHMGVVVEVAPAAP